MHKFVTLFTIILATALVLAACPPPPVEPPEVEPIEVEPEAVELRFQSWRLADPVFGDMYMGWIEEYQELHPHVTVEPEPVPFAQRLEVYTTQVLAGAPPDVVGLTAGDVVQFAGLGQVENLDDFYAQEGEEYTERFAPVALSLAEYEGSYYAIVHEFASADGVWYNIQYLEEAGIDPEEAISSWGNFVEALTALTAEGRFGIPVRGRDVTGAMSAMWPYLMQKAGPLVTEDEIRDTLCSPAAKDVFQNYVELYTVHQVTPSPIDVDFTVQMEMFAHGRAAFLHNGHWMRAIIEDENPEMIGNFLPLPIPLFEDGNPVVTVDGMALMIGRGTENAEEAWNFMKFITSREKQLENFGVSGFLPSLTELIDSPQIQEDPVARVFLPQMVEYGVPRPRSVQAAEMWSAVHEEFHNALLETKTPEDALEDACTRINTEILD